MLRIATSAALMAVLISAAPSPESLVPVAPKKSVAVLYFDNHTGRSDYEPLGKGIASMLISDLSPVPEIQLLERERIQDLVKEMEAQHTRYYDSTTAVRVGQLSGAEYIVVGAFAAVQPKMRIDTRVVRVATGEIVKTAQATGDENDFFAVEQQLAKNLVDGLGIALSPEEQQRLAEQQEANRVNAVNTMLGFSRALQLYDRSDFGGAAQTMLPVMQASPNSALLRLTFDEMKRRATNSAADKAKEKIKSGLGGFLRRP